MASPPFLYLFSLLLFSLLPFSLCSNPGVRSISRLLDLQDRERAPPSVQVSAAYGVLSRLLPSHSSSFEFQIVSKGNCGGDSCFMISNHPSYTGQGSPEILISGATGVELSAGLHYYLKNFCGAHISWDKTGGAQLSSVPKPGALPSVPNGVILVTRPVPWNYYQNAVTSSYTFAWWDWERWEKEIDWMALQGINLPLAFTGQEAIWQKVFQKFNISRSDLNDFFGGPAFLAWSRMGNLHRWGGPLSQSWLDQQLILQKRILARMFELGMNPGLYFLYRENTYFFSPYFPVLPAFSGNVPAALKNVFTSAKITHLGNWFSVGSNPQWCCTYLLDATDPLFVEIGKAFIEQQLEGSFSPSSFPFLPSYSKISSFIFDLAPDNVYSSSEYGRTGHIYNCDTFDENTPPVDDPEYISSLGSAIFKAMESGDNDAVWLMQGWLFIYDPFWRPPQMKALLQSVPVGKLVVLDLFAEVKSVWSTSEQFYGVPYIWCMLHNFAGNIEMYGLLDSVGSGPIEARTSKNSTMLNLSSSPKVGVGMSMEAIEQNPVVYDLMSEMAFQHKKRDIKTWIEIYTERRYGRSLPSVKDAWNILYHTLYNCTDGKFNKNRDVIVAFPDVDPSFISIPGLAMREDNYPSIRTTVRRALLEEESNSYDPPHLWYSTAEVIHALELFLASGDELSGSNTFRYDLVDLTRQALAKYANQLFLTIIKAYQSNDLHGVISDSRKFMDLVQDMDRLLASHEGFLLAACLTSPDPHSKLQYEWNARTQITMWFDNTEEEPSLLRDYANKYWSGLLNTYYGPRAGIYFKFLIESLEKGVGFRLTDWRREWIKLTTDWQNDRSAFPTSSIGNALDISRELYVKYLQEFGLPRISHEENVVPRNSRVLRIKTTENRGEEEELRISVMSDGT
ncbi:Alpha-N-acetylglucosaminidase, N-terminal [Dillenia turbinata]|uniref:Alpha-N-acetylglucosaminidase, N-terminal n=1 Tax=Dillenia turbinata TaxID=194707 RepID=A0AAN8Z184_9MAGN